MATGEQNTVWLRGEGGAVFELELPLHPDMQNQLIKGTCQRINPDGTPYTDQPTEQVPALPTERPADDADRAQWVGWAVAHGMDLDDAEALTVPDLIDLYGKPDPEQRPGIQLNALADASAPVPVEGTDAAPVTGADLAETGGIAPPVEPVAAEDKAAAVTEPGKPASK